MLSLGGSYRNTAVMFGIEKLEWCAYLAVKEFYDMFSCFDRILACDRGMDRHLATAQSALYIRIMR